MLRPGARADETRHEDGPRLLFLPRCGAHGIGEYVRCLTLAQALCARRKDAQAWFAVEASLPRLPGDAFPRLELARGARQGQQWGAMLARLQPQLVVSNNRGRQRELAHARGAGAAVVAIFSTERRSRARRLDVLRSVDQLWIVPGEGRAGARPPSRLARWLAGSPHCEIVETLHPAPDAVRAMRLRSSLGLGAERYALFCAGGGGWRLGERPAPEIFAAAAERVAATGVRAVLVAGPLRRGAGGAAAGVTQLAAVGPSAMVDLLCGAELVVCAGGGLLGWVQALGRPCVTTPMPCGDQIQRTAACRAQGTARVVEGSEQALADGALTLWHDAAARGALTRRLAEVGPRNALPRCIELLEALLHARQRATPGMMRRGSPQPPIASEEPDGSEAALESSSTTSRPA